MAVDFAIAMNRYTALSVLKFLAVADTQGVALGIFYNASFQDLDCHA